MKALTICQPYAYLIAMGEKRVENRVWSTGYRGWLAIHAGKSREWLRPGDDYFPMAFGEVVAIVRLVACLPRVKLPHFVLKTPRYAWLLTDPYVEGPILWVLEDVRIFTEPVAYRGQRGLFEIPDSVLLV